MNTRLRNGFIIVLLVLLMTLTASAQASHAAVSWYVAPDGSDSSSCLAPAAPCATINAAIAKAAAGDTVYVAKGVYTGTGEEVVLINKDISLSGGWNANFTEQPGHSTLDGELARQGIFVASQAQATIDRFIVERGVLGYDETLRDDIVSGIFVEYDAALNLEHSIIRKNYYGIVNIGNLTLNNSIVSYNTSGGISNYGSLEINSSTIYKNTHLQAYGGGIENSGELVINNSTISYNGAGSNGGGISNGYPGTLVINSTTIIGNNAAYGGGIWTNEIVTLRNSIVAKNQANSSPDCSGEILSLGHNIIGDTSGCTYTAADGDLVDTDAMLGSLIGETDSSMYHPLLSASPAIDAGDPAGCFGSQGLLDTDQRGAARVGICDIGAYEFTAPGQPDVVSILEGSPQHADMLADFRIPFQVAVLDNIGSPVNGAVVTFTVPLSGPSGKFMDTGSWYTVGETMEEGIASASTLTANTIEGDYALTVSANGVSPASTFELSNSSGLYVSQAGDDSNSCLYSNNPCASINTAVQKGIAGDRVFISEGIYTGIGHTAVLVDRDLTLLGGWDDAFAIQDGFSIVDGQGNRVGVIISEDITATLKSFIIQNGDGNSLVGGILNAGTTSLNRVVVRNNGAGGISNYKVLNVNNSSIVLNNGDGIYSAGQMNVNSSSIIGNLGTGISQIGDSGTSPVYLQNTVVAKNLVYGTAQDCTGEILSSGYNLIGSVSECGFVASTGDLINTDAVLGPFEDDPGFYPLRPSSPAMDAGNPSGCEDHLGELITTDLRGVARVGRCDMGAYEYDPQFVTTHYLSMPILQQRICPSFVDDFSNPNSGWPINDDGLVRYEYLNGEYRILLREGGWWAGANPGFQASDYKLEVDVRNATGSYGIYGLLFGLNEDWSQFYALFIDPEGYYGIMRYDYSTGWTMLAEDYSSSIYQGTAINHLKLEHIGASIKAYANGTLLKSLTDGTFTGPRWMGLTLASFDSSLDVRFDNFSVKTIDCFSTGLNAILERSAPGIDASQDAALPEWLMDHSQR